MKERGEIEFTQLCLLVLLYYLQKSCDVAVRLRRNIEWVTMPACTASKDPCVATEASLEGGEAIIEPAVLSLPKGILVTVLCPLVSPLQLFEEQLGLLGKQLHYLFKRLRHIMLEIVDALPRLATVQDNLLN